MALKSQEREIYFIKRATAEMEDASMLTKQTSFQKSGFRLQDEGGVNYSRGCAWISNITFFKKKHYIQNMATLAMDKVDGICYYLY